MTCDEYRDLMADGEQLPAPLRESAMAHGADCPQCAKALHEMRAIRAALRAPCAIDVKRGSQATLKRVYAAIDDEEPERSLRWAWRPFAGFLATAALALFAITTLTPQETTAFTLDDLANQHRMCVFEGHHMDNHCSTETAFAEMTMAELGFASRPFEAPGKGAFLKGGTCRIGGNQVAHVLLDVGGETVSYFRLFNADETLIEGENWTARSAGVWSMERKGHLVVLRQFAEGDYGLYTGKVTLEKLEEIWGR